MKRLAGFAAIVALSLGGAVSARAHDEPDGVDCGMAHSGIYHEDLTAKRGAICLHGRNGHVLFYAGGSLQAQEDPQRDDLTQLCGAIVVADFTVAGNADWDRTDEDGTVHHCD